MFSFPLDKYPEVELLDYMVICMGVCNIVQEAVIKIIPKKKKCKKAKWLSEEALQISSCEKKRSERQRRKGKVYPFEHRVPKNSKES